MTLKPDDEYLKLQQLIHDAMRRAEWQTGVARWDQPKKLLPEPEFGLEEIEQAEKVMKDLG